MQIQITDINLKTPLLFIQDSSPRWNRVFGAQYIKTNKTWYFPGFTPLLNYVVKDIPCIDPEVTFSPLAHAWITEQKNLTTWLDEVHTYAFHTKCLEHQYEGIAELLCNWRWILQWDMGTGKTKIVLDALTILKSKALVICPVIAVANWVAEAQKHAPHLHIFTMYSDTKNKFKVLKSAIHTICNILVVPYDTATTFGNPHISLAAAKLCQLHNMVIHPPLKRALLKINGGKRQVEYIEQWLAGTPSADIEVQIDNYVTDNPQWISDYPYDTVVLDESHRIKTHDSARTLAVLQLANTAKRRYLLSGTFVQGDPRDLYPQLKCVSPAMMEESYYHFCNRHVVKDPHNKHIVVGYKELDRLNGRLAMISSVRKLADCVDLPERQFITIHYQLNSSQKIDYNLAVTDWEVEIGDPNAINSSSTNTKILEIANGAVRVTKLLQLCSGFIYYPTHEDVCDTCLHVYKCVTNFIRPGTVKCVMRDLQDMPERVAARYANNPKLIALRELVEDITISGKVIIWAVMVEELDNIVEMLTKLRLKHVRVDGSNSKHVQEYANTFNEDPECLVYVAQIKTGISITLNSAAYMIYYSRDWSLDSRNQSLARNYRIGQEQKTVVYDLCALGTVETQQLMALQSKENISTLLTKRVNCLICTRYTECLKENIVVWSSKCVLTSRVKREITKTRVLG